ncbi:hypothetical protein [Algoriphagus limi]|uniref:Uncharacterized protein n=1 Tax=Algoriphagus limi TaxID=2975273 RepID=A0ABT2G4Q2_9BACT|nr:hypothetical protein [Algoriphagus limi]MCS5489010.1 hypothetical protein [Algoriphagus limi]
MEFNKLRSKVIDHPVFVMQSRSNQIEKDTDWFFFSRWMFEELEIGKEDLIQKKAELDKELFSLKELKNGFYRIILVQLTELFKSMLILTLLIGFLYLKFSWKKKLVFIFSWLTFFLTFNHFNMLLGRVNLLFFLILLFPILKIQYSVLKSNFWNVSSIVLVGFLVVHTFNFLKEADGRKIINKEFYDLLSYTNSETPVFLEGFFEYNFLDQFNYTNLVPVLSYGWISRSSFQRKAYQKRGFNKQSDLEDYYILAFKLPGPLAFSDYMNKISPGFNKSKRFETTNLELMYFSKR